MKIEKIRFKFHIDKSLKQQRLSTIQYICNDNPYPVIGLKKITS